MAINEIQVGRLNAALHKTLAMKEGAPAPTLGPEVVPVLALESDRPEWAFLKGEKLAGGQSFVGALAANNSLVQLFNPAGTGALLIVTRLVVTIGASADAFVGLNTTALANDRTNKAALDTRGEAPTLTTGLIRDAQVAAIAGVTNFWQQRLTAEQPFLAIDHNNPVILSEGHGLVVGPATQNTAVWASFTWRERFLEPSETR